MYAPRVTKLPNLSIELQKEPEPIRVPDELPPLPATIVYFGVRGSGKTTAIQSMLRKYKAANLMNRLFLISPTYKSNSFLFDGIIDDEDVYEEAVQASLNKVIDKVQQEADEWKAHEENKMIWSEYKKQEKKYLAGEIEEIEPEVLNAAVEAGLTLYDRFPEYKYPGVQRPQMWLVLDDIQSSALFNPNTKVKNNLNNVLIKTRHMGGSRFGLNVVIALQNYKLQTGGLSKALRMNTTAMALFGYRDKKLIEDIHKEISREVSEEEFAAAFDYATAGEKYNHLFLEFGSNIRLRKNFDEILDLTGLKTEAQSSSGSGSAKPMRTAKKLLEDRKDAAEESDGGKIFGR